ncbi:lysosome-associated membrane glycoprotein 5 isoform X2 [Spea bombifrons]|uniref:lysosome-associated membrane glycoprotein 5 isoform X2 n=1 Tax=Spea bombifrons TaxID=233779 RepID=UPI00234AEC65|nr:lysosome-associated membrane glycoprotein 5 isoform X2 [Spea bombifrons]
MASRSSCAVLGLQAFILLLYTVGRNMAEQEVENLSGLSSNPAKNIFAIRENGTTCLMAEFAAKIIVPYEVPSINEVDWDLEEAIIQLPRDTEIKGKCWNNESELHLSWLDKAYTLKLSFLKEDSTKSHGKNWKLNKIQFSYNVSERTNFKNGARPGKHTASKQHLSLMVTPIGMSYECDSPERVSLTSTDHQKIVTLLLSDVHIQPFDINSDFVYSEDYRCQTDQRKQLEESLPVILGITLGVAIVIILAVYHIHHKMTANQVQLPRDRSLYKHMG